MRLIKKVFGRVTYPVTFGVGHQIAYYWDRKKNWFAFWPHDPKIEADLVLAVQTMLDMARKEGWPPLRVYAVDEAGAHNLLDEAVYYYSFLKKHFPSLKTFTTIGGGIAMGHDEIGRLSACIDFFATNRFTPEIARKLEQLGRPFGLYNGAGHTPAGARFFFGFYGWKSSAAYIGQWVYYFGNSVFQGNGIRRDDEGLVYLAKDGPLPSLMWEAVREGIDDYRYLYLFWTLVSAAKSSNDPAVKKAAEQASAELGRILEQVPWEFMAIAHGNRVTPPHPATLRKWRARIAAGIVKLSKLGIRFDSALPSRARPKATELTWARQKPLAWQTGPGLFKTAGFEKGLGPWLVQPWNGKGKGVIDTSEAHAGKQSVRIDIPQDQGSNAVTVLVWPSWGKRRLRMTLEADRVYELSAWFKMKARGTPPQLRMVIPGSAISTTQSGQDKPDSNGWRRIWMRTQVKYPVQPRYLAVWVQGPGTVWVDDISLREAIPPLFKAALDQKKYDENDSLGVLSLRLRKTAVPARIHFGIVDSEGSIVSELITPYQCEAIIESQLGKAAAMCAIAPARLNPVRLVFNPSTLPVGPYELHVTLLDAQDKVMGTEVIQFRRIRTPL